MTARSLSEQVGSYESGIRYGGTVQQYVTGETTGVAYGFFPSGPEPTAQESETAKKIDEISNSQQVDIRDHVDDGERTPTQTEPHRKFSVDWDPTRCVYIPSSCRILTDCT